MKEKVAVSPEPSLVAPDWTQPFRDIEADLWESEFGSDQLLLKGNVHLNLGNTSFSANEFWYHEKTNEVRAKGNVLIVQGPAEIAANEIYYRVAAPGEAPKALIL